MERKPSKHARTRSGAGAAAGGVLASFLRSTAASFSSSTTNFAARAGGAGGKSSFNHRNAFSGPLVSIVPPEARRRRGSKQAGVSGSGYRTPEASSPKVSCIGQIKRSKSKRKTKAARKAAKTAPVVVACGMDGGACPLPPRPPAATRPKISIVKRMLFRRSSSRSSSSSKSSGNDGFKGRGSTVAAAPAPAAGLGQMKRFTSGRGAFQDFDWTEQAEPRRGSDVDAGADGYDYSFEDDGFVAHSAPLVLGGGVVASEPRKEVNLWRRRPMSPPTPLQLP